MHLGNPKTSKIFIKNFFTDFKDVLGRKHTIKKFELCDFEPIRKHLNEQKIIRKAITDAERKANKDGRNQALFQFGFAIVDGHVEKVGNYNMVGKDVQQLWSASCAGMFGRDSHRIHSSFILYLGTTWGIPWTW